MNAVLNAKDLVAQFKLRPHPEGGYFRESYRSKESIPHSSLPKRFAGDRNFSTAIYFLLEAGNFSAFHKIKSDECWHFYEGSTLLIYVIHLNGRLEIIRLGNNPHQGEQYQAVVPAECWFASAPAPGGSFSFVGCTVAPGFDFSDFQLADTERLSTLYPSHRSLIRQLTR